MTAPLDLLAGLRLEDGGTWADSAVEFQWELARKVLADPSARQFWAVRPRGGRKSTDVAGMVLSLLATDAPPASRSYIGAADEDQAAEVVDAARGLIDRTPGLPGLFAVTGLRIANQRTGATVEALPADASAMGKRPWLIVLDEVTNWPDSRAAQQFWNVLSSAARKVPNCRLVVISNAGLTEHWSFRRWETALASPLWWTQEVQGPLSWLSPEDVQALRENATTPSEFDRLTLGRWVTGDDVLVSLKGARECVTHQGPLLPRPGIRYAIAVDLGVRNDRTALVVGHRDGIRVVVDRVQLFAGSRARPVRLETVEETLLALSRDYNRAELVFDPWQGIGMAQRLREAGVRVHEFSFTATSVGRLASALWRALTDRTVCLPDDEALLDELAHARLRTNSAGVTRLDHDSGKHDDMTVAVAMVIERLLSTVTRGGGRMRFYDTSARPEALTVHGAVPFGQTKDATSTEPAPLLTQSKGSTMKNVDLGQLEWPPEPPGPPPGAIVATERMLNRVTGQLVAAVGDPIDPAADAVPESEYGPPAA